jgi:alcohol dehydrogenase (NADP+)
LEEAHADGAVRAIGVSNFDTHQLQELLMMTDTKPGLLQNWMDPFHQDNGVRALCREHGITYMAYSTFGTQWTHKRGENPVFSSVTLQAIAAAHSSAGDAKTVSDVVISWAVQEGVVVLPRSTQEAHIAANAGMLPSAGHSQYATFLSDDDMTTIRALDGSIGSLW